MVGAAQRREGDAVVAPRAIAWSMAKVPPIWPIELPPSTTIAPPRCVTTPGRPRGSTPSRVSFRHSRECG